MRITRIIATVLSLTCLSVMAGMSSTAAPVTLTFVECWGPPRSEWIREYLDEFEAAHPGIKVEHIVQGCGEITPKFIAAFAGGTSPDLVMAHTWDLVGFADNNMLYPIDKLMARDNLARNYWYDSELASGNWQGVQYGLPVRAGGDANTVIYYNADLLHEAGLDPKKLPETLAELTEVGRKLVRYDGDRIVVSPGYPAGDSGDYDTMAWLYAGGGEFYSKDLRTITFHQGGGLRIAEELAKMNQIWHRSPADALTGLENFLAGKLAIFQTGSWQWTVISQGAGFNFTVGPRPRLDTSIPYTGAHVGTWHYILPRGKHTEEAWELMKWLTTRQDTIGDFLLRQGRLAPIPTMNANPEYLKINRDIMALARAMSMAAPVPIIPIGKDLMNIHSQALKDIVSGKEAAEIALTNARHTAQALLDEYWRKKK